MGKKKTVEELQNEIFIKFPNIKIVGGYTDVQTPVSCICEIDGHQWKQRPIVMKRDNYKGCPKCNNRNYWDTKSLTVKMKKVNSNILILGEYVGYNKKIKCKCLIDGYEWTPTPYNILHGRGCPKCACQPAKDTEKFIEELKAISPNIKIVGEYVNAKTKIDCECLIDGYTWSATPDSLLRGNGCLKCCKRVPLTIEDAQSKIYLNFKNIIIEEFNGSHKNSVFRCLKDNHIWTQQYSNLLLSKGCPRCNNTAIIEGYNDLKTMRPDLLKFLTNERDAIGVATSSHSKISTICPDCGNISFKQVSTLSRRGFSCSACGDGVSYPNKFIYNLLNQSNIEYFKEHSFDWDDTHRVYDIFIPSLNLIIENHGEQHYVQSNRGRSLLEEQTNDKNKMDKALKNGIKHYIQLDCRESSLEWIKESIVNSKLVGFIDIEDIDFSECDKFASKSLIKTVADLWNTNQYLTKDICKIMELSLTTVNRYLHKATKLKLCEYFPRKS